VRRQSRDSRDNKASGATVAYLPRFALCALLPDNALNVFIKIQGEKKWQTYQFVRNQMDHT